MKPTLYDSVAPRFAFPRVFLHIGAALSLDGEIDCVRLADRSKVVAFIKSIAAAGTDLQPAPHFRIEDYP
jgi:hypothetical protein